VGKNCDSAPNDGGLVGAGAMHMDRTKKVGGLLTSPDARRLVTGVRAATHISHS